MGHVGLLPLDSLSNFDMLMLLETYHSFFLILLMSHLCSYILLELLLSLDIFLILLISHLFVFLNSIIIILGLDNMKQESSNFNIPNFAIYLYYKQWNVKGIRKIQDAQKFSQNVEFLKLCVKAHWMHIFDQSFFPHWNFTNWNKNFTNLIWMSSICHRIFTMDETW